MSDTTTMPGHVVNSWLKAAEDKETRARYALDLLDELDAGWAGSAIDTDVIPGRHDARAEIAKYAAELYKRAGDSRRRASEVTTA